MREFGIVDFIGLSIISYGISYFIAGLFNDGSRGINRYEQSINAVWILIVVLPLMAYIMFAP